MVYTDRWNVYSNGTVAVGLDTVVKIIGTSSLAISVNNAAAQVNLVPTVTGGLPQPALRGKMRQVLRFVNLGGGRKIGFAAVQSARNITTSGSAYVAYIDGGTLFLAKTTTGLSGTLTTLASIPFGPLVIDTNYIFELEWNVDNAQLGGVDLLTKVIRLSTFPVTEQYVETALVFNIDKQLHHIDKTSPLLATLGNGPIFITPGSPSTVDVRYDATILYA